MTTISNIAIRDVRINVPYKFIWSYSALVIISGSTHSKWTEGFPNTMFWMAFIVGMTMIAYGFYLFCKFYSKTSVKRILVNSDDDIVITYQKPRYGNDYNYDSSFLRQSLRLVHKKKGLVHLMQQDKIIAKVYRNTLKNKADWNWLIDYLAS